MSDHEWIFWVYLVKDGERHGLLLKRRAEPGGGTDHAYFFIDDGEGLVPNEAILGLCGSSVQGFTPNGDERRILDLLIRCSQFVSRHKDRFETIPLDEVYDVTQGEYSHEVPKLFETSRSYGNAKSKLRQCLVNWHVFSTCVLEKCAANLLRLRAKDFRVATSEQLTPNRDMQYLQPIKDVLAIGEEAAPVWFRKTGPVASDFDAGIVFSRQELLETLKSLVHQNSVCLLEGTSATGKSVLVKNLAYNLYQSDGTPVYYFSCDEDRDFHWTCLLEEIRSVRGVIVIEDIHLATDKIQSICTRLKGENIPHVLFTARTSVPHSQREKYDDLTKLPNRKLQPFEDVDGIIDHYVKCKSLSRLSKKTRQAIKKVSSASFWLLAYALEGYARSEGRGHAQEWLATGVQEDLEELAKLKEPYAYQYPKILVALSPLYKNEVLTEQGYLLKEGFGFNEQALGALARRGEITRRRTSQGHVFYGLPHSGLADAYWEHGMEYRNSLGLPEYESFIYAYAVSDACNGLEAVDSGRPDERVNVLRRLYETGDIVGVVEREKSLSRITLWVTDTGRKPHLAKALRRQDLLEVIARKLDESDDIATQVECIGELFLTDALAGQTLWSLIDRPQFASKLIEIDNALLALFRLLDVDREAGWDLWELLDVERLAAKMDREYWSDGLALSVFLICDANREIGLRLLTHLDLKLLASSLGRADTVLDIHLDLESLCYASSFVAGEVCRMLDLNLIARRLTNEDDQKSACKCIQTIWNLDQACCLQLMSLVENNDLVQSMKNILCSRPTGD